SLDEKRKKRDQIQNEMNEKFKRVNKSTESLDVPDSATTPLDAKAALKKDETSKDLSSAEPIPTAPVKDEKSTPNLTPGNSSTLEEQKKETASINRKLSSSYKKEQRNKTFYNTNPKDRVKAEPKMVETPSIDSTETKKPKFETVEEFITSTTKNENEKKAEFKEDMISQPTETSKTEKAKESIEESSEFEPGFLSKNDTEEDEYKWDDRDPKPGIVARRRIEQRNAQRGDDSIVKPKVQEGPVKDSVKVGDIDTTSDKPGVESKTTQPRPFQKQPERSQFSFSALPNDRQKKFSFGPTVKESSIQFDIYEGYKEIALEDAKKSNNKLSKIIVSAELAPQLLYQEINEGPNSAVVSFLLSLINKMTPEEFLNELNYYKILPPLTGLSKNDIADFIEISEKAITTFKNVRRNGLLNRDSAITLSIWLRNRLVIEYAKQSTNKASVNDLSSTDKANKEYASKALGYKPDANTNFANAITNFNNPITPDHLLQLGSIFKHPVVVIDLDNEKAALPQVDSPNNIYMIKTKGDSEEKEHYAALMDAQKLTEKVSAPKLQSSGRKAEIEESIISSEKTPEAEKVLEGEYEDMPVNVSIGAGEIDTDEIDIESDENKKSLEAKNTTFSIGVGTKQPITLEEAKIKNLELKNINSNLKYQEIEDNSNSAVTAFLMALINKMSSEDFEKELKQNELIKLGVNSNALMVQKDLDGYNIVSNMAVQSFQNVKKSGLINDSDVFTLTKWLRYRIAIEYRMESFKETKDVDFKSLDDSIKAFAKAYYGDERMPRTYDAFTTAIADLDFPITAEHLILLGKIFKHPVVVLESGSKVPQVTDYPSDNIYLIKKEVEFKKYNARAQPGQKLDHYDALIETKKL
ncbi:MAG: hypothetical protein JHC93_08320, partial [Parachlamydiales bacterium]|nr:hypothetical protein [Parachlamydiales bacterium]